MGASRRRGHNDARPGRGRCRAKEVVLDPVIIISGGLDSIAIWRLAGCPPAVHFSLGTIAGEREAGALKWAERWGRIYYDGSLSYLGASEMENGYLPYRNALMVMRAATYGDTIIVGQVAEWAPDKNRRFWKRLERLMNEMGRGDYQGIEARVRITAPYYRVTKGELLRRYYARFGLDAARELCASTWSCYFAGETHCGACSGCSQRYVAESVAFGTPYTSFLKRPAMPQVTAADALRAVRGNGLASVPSMLRRVSEASILRGS
jgi:hypothetical protein